MARKAAEPDAVVDGGAVEDVPPEVVEASRPEPAELVVRPDVPEDVYRAMDAADEMQIMDALAGRPSEVMVYSFKGKDGKLQTGLSYEGVAEAVREMNSRRVTAIRVAKDVTPVIVAVTDEDENDEMVTAIEALVYAEDVANGGGNWGTARQPKFQTFKDRNRKPRLDSFATAKALSKAQRNAMKPLVPVALREEMIARHLGNPLRVKELRLGMGDPQAEMPPPLTDERALALKARIREVFAAIRDIDPMVLLPGRFNHDFRRTEHEHPAMEEYLAALESQLAYLQAGKAGAS
jgi:hypothetical protein